MRNILVLFVFSLLFVSCNKKDRSNNKEAEVNNLVGEIISFDSNSSASKIFNEQECWSDYKLVLTFDGTCSTCIVQFLKFVSSTNDLLKEWNCVFVSFSNDTYEIEFHMEGSNITLNECQTLLVDKNQSFLKNNPFINSTNNIFIINNKNKIVEQIEFYYKKEEALKILNKYKSAAVN